MANIGAIIRRMIGGDNLYTDGRTPPFVGGGEDPYFEQDEYGNPIFPGGVPVSAPAPTMPAPAPPQGRGRKVANILGGMLMQGIDAAATPNIAFGGPTDVFRAAQASQDARIGRESQSLNQQIARENLESNRETRRSQAEENLARAEYWRKKMELEGKPKPAVEPNLVEDKDGNWRHPKTGAIVVAAKPKTPPPMVKVGIGQQGEPDGFAPALSVNTPDPMGGEKTLDFPAYGAMVELPVDEAKKVWDAGAAIKKASTPPAPKEDMAVTAADALARANDPSLTPEQRKRWKDTYDQLMRDARTLRSINPSVPKNDTEYVFRKNPDGTFDKYINVIDRSGKVVSSRVEKNVVPPGQQPQDLLGLGGGNQDVAPAPQSEGGGFWDGLTNLFGSDEDKPKTQPQQGVPKPGTVEDGYRFKGGNPADPKNWVKVQ